MGINKFLKIGSKMKAYRKEAGISQLEMATKLKLSPSTYSNYENGHREPPLDIVVKFCDILSLDVVDLTYSNEDKEKLIKGFIKGLGIENTKLESIDIISLMAGSPDILENYSDTVKITLDTDNNKSQKQLLLTPFEKLNEKGQKKAIEQVEMLTKIPEYRKNND